MPSWLPTQNHYHKNRDYPKHEGIPPNSLRLVHDVTKLPYYSFCNMPHSLLYVITYEMNKTVEFRSIVNLP